MTKKIRAAILKTLETLITSANGDYIQLEPIANVYIDMLAVYVESYCNKRDGDTLPDVAYTQTIPFMLFDFFTAMEAGNTKNIETLREGTAQVKYGTRDTMNELLERTAAKYHTILNRYRRAVAV